MSNDPEVMSNSNGAAPENGPSDQVDLERGKSNLESERTSIEFDAPGCCNDYLSLDIYFSSPCWNYGGNLIRSI